MNKDHYQFYLLDHFDHILSYLWKVFDIDDNDNWLIGKGLLLSDNEPMAMRSFIAPGTAYKDHPIFRSDTQVSHMRDYVDLAQDRMHDSGGAHINSGIPNHAFYLAATAIDENTWGKIGHIWFEALQQSRSNDDFAIFAQRTVTASTSLGFDAEITEKVKVAWNKVGINVS